MKVNLQSDSRPNSLIHSFRHPVIQIASVLLPIFKFSNQQTFKSLQLCCPFSNFQINKLSNCFSFAAHFQIVKSKNLQIASALLPIFKFSNRKIFKSLQLCCHFQIFKSTNFQIASALLPIFKLSNRKIFKSLTLPHPPAPDSQSSFLLNRHCA
jgi:hypothetical protein